MRYYDIVRLENQGMDQECFETVKKMVSRGWVNKAHDYLQQWNYGEENIATAMSYGAMRSSITDFRSDRIVRSFSFSGERFYLCTTDGMDGYEAFYLVGEYDGEED